jgi:hypothetical protein
VVCVLLLSSNTHQTTNPTMKSSLIILFLLFCQIVIAQSTLITPGNNQPNLESTSVTGGFLPSRLTSIQRDAIPNPNRRFDNL